MVTTWLEQTHPRITIEMTDGQVAALQLSPEVFAKHEHNASAFEAVLIPFLRRAVHQHGAAILARTLEQTRDSATQAERHVMAFLDQQAPISEEPPPLTTPGRGDVAAASGVVTCRLADGLPVACEIDDYHVSREFARTVEHAVRTALNEAMTLDADSVLGGIHAGGLAEEPSDWDDLNARIERHRRAEFR